MRLSQEQIVAIYSSVEKFIPKQVRCELKLFGSRVSDEERGGDIDLVLITESVKSRDDLRLLDFKILANIKSHRSIGEQKIDLKIISQRELGEPFFTEVLKNSISIKKW